MLTAVKSAEKRYKTNLNAVAPLLDIPEDISDLAVIWVDQGFSEPNFVKMVSGICDARVEVIK